MLQNVCSDVKRPVFDLQSDHSVVRRRAALGRAAGIEDPGLPEPRRLGHVRVAVDDRVTAGESLDEPSGPTGHRPGVMDDPDSHAFVLDDELRREDETKVRLVHVPDDAVDRRQLPKLLVHRH